MSLPCRAGEVARASATVGAPVTDMILNARTLVIRSTASRDPPGDIFSIALKNPLANTPLLCYNIFRTVKSKPQDIV